MLLDILPTTARKKYTQQEKTLNGLSAYLMTIEDGEVDKWSAKLFRDLTIIGKETVNTEDVKEVQDKVRKEVKEERKNIESYLRASNKKDAETKKNIVDNDLNNYCTKKTIFDKITEEAKTVQRENKSNQFWKDILSPAGLFFGLLTGFISQPTTIYEWLSLGVIMVFFGVGVFPAFNNNWAKKYRKYFICIGFILPILLLIAHIICFNILKITV